ncbi:hypothetical protein BBH99_05620 [Chryseobacterium contaminans]|uniref:Branched-chain amino acid:cation transporter, LIVCS family n=1 Tax=Chryseobacterium contaminans TaxID=1423959 RepID=A0A1M7HZT4_9FLAO|nr:hypothetical protein [Chryseobacterium contaminans]OCA79723.1 hypothetical protein BBH99_05620 [Chryseobacterium contaminans]SHM33899.1 hypothetical protein SAMN05444407_11348 [Chryseobacterium contaminans]
MENIKFSTAGKYTFLISLGVGTFLFLLFLITGNDLLLIYGFMYVIFAILVNVTVLVCELLVFLTDISERKDSGNSVLLLLANIPIAILYLLVIFNFY